MISKKWRNLDKNLIENNEKNSNEEVNSEKIIYNKEIVIVDVNNSRGEGEYQENEENEEKETIINKSNHLRTKPKPLLSVDFNSINLVDYKIRDKNNDSYKRYDNYYRGYDDFYHFQPRNYTYKSLFNSKNNANKHDNSLTKSNNYTYSYSSRYNINNKRNYKQPYKLNKSNNITYADYLKNKYKNSNINLAHYINYEEKANYIKPKTLRNYQVIDKDEKIKKRNNTYLSERQRLNRGYSWRSTLEERKTYVINDCNNNLRPVILIENKNKNNDSIDSKLNYIYI